MPAVTQTEQAADGGRVVRVSGDVDHTDAPGLRDAVFAAIDDATSSTPVTVDLAAVTFVDSSALGALVEIRAYAHDLGRSVVLTNVPSRVVAIMTMSGLDGVFDLRRQPRSRA